MRTYEDIADIVTETSGLLAKPAETRFLFETAAALPHGQNILEIGSYRGLSSLCLAFGAQNINGRLFCFSMWHNDISISWHDNMKKNKLDPMVMYGDANIALEHVTVSNVGLIFIDSGHSYEDCKTQFELAIRSAVPGCIVAFHDYGHPNYPGVKQYCDELATSGALRDTQKYIGIFYGKAP